MTTLSKPLRRQLETAIKQVREISREAAQEAIARIGVAEAEAPEYLVTEESKALRRRLRAHARTLGDTRDAAGGMSTARLQDATSYEIWHRMLFGRFLAERGLLIHPESGEAIRGVYELRDLAQEEGVADEWALAERYAAPGLPGVFKPDDPVLAIPIAPNYLTRLRAVLSGLPADIFAADDSLGWTYQFWQASEKDAVNKAGGKIGATELPAVTQLFTEPYMVKFLLHNTLGAWWAGKVLAARPDLARDAEDEDALRHACALPDYRWEFLRFVREGEVWRPASGTYPGWPQAAADITVLDPCCGSGHFLTEALAALTALRVQEEGLSSVDATVAVLRDNLAGLEIDGRCVQIAAFALALVAWRIAGPGTAILTPHVAWVGAPPPLAKSEFAALANGDAELRRGLEALHDLFSQAPLLGSLIEPVGGDLVDPARVARIEDGITVLVERMRGVEPDRVMGAVAARSMADAAAILAKKWVLQITNVPFLGLSKAHENLQHYVQRQLGAGVSDLYIAFLLRMRRSRAAFGTISVVTPQNWYNLVGNQTERSLIVESDVVHLVCDLGPAAFHDMNWWAQRTALTICSQLDGDVRGNEMCSLDAESGKGPDIKAENCKVRYPSVFPQSELQDSPNCVILMQRPETSQRLGAHAVCLQGVSTGDNERLTRYFLEVNIATNRWRYFQGVPDGNRAFSGLKMVVDQPAILSPDDFSPAIRGHEAWNKIGIIFGQMRHLPFGVYTGEWYSNSSPVMIAQAGDANLGAIWAFVSSGRFLEEIRKVNRKSSVDNGYFTKVAFDLAHWQEVAAQKYPDGLPEPYSDDPTQWLFHGHPRFAESGTELHVALARLAGYRWPAETDPDMRLSDLARQRIMQAAALPAADAEGLLPLHATSAKPSLADRVRAMLEAAFGTALSPAQEQALVRSADAKFDKKEARDATLEAWLRDRAFRQHCVLFHQRPFLWQVWDGLQGGFSAFLHYHRLDDAALNTLTYTLLGDWIRTAKAEGNTARQERAEQLQQKLAKIIEGEDPYDIFVRWKPLARQPLGWDPDLDDGVRLNIRPFMTAGILREQPKGINWNKDRGTDVPSAPWYDLGPRYGGKQGDRINDHHTTLAEKRAARGIG